ncbi:MAG: pyridoxal 5'-phosphate synthase glutaminase subunit PdxT [Actinobacteria bacterium]|nr:MAG: pyridoxal 5'-phosphate synthase glutaminase subunit PdxT [Actinomycetota bacterium]
MVKIGVLALQGAVREHIHKLQECQVKAVVIKRVTQLEDLDGLIIPGGESTTMGKLMVKYGFTISAKKMAQDGLPIWGTCAGLVLLAKEVVDGLPDQPLLSLMDISVRRNAFGRQNESCEAFIGCRIPRGGAQEGSHHAQDNSEHDGKLKRQDPEATNFPAIFIRAPWIEKVGKGVEILAKYQDKVVAARQGNLLVTSFHPELTDDLRFHQYFVNIIESRGVQVKGFNN